MLTGPVLFLLLGQSGCQEKSTHESLGSLKEAAEQPIKTSINEDEDGTPFATVVMYPAADGGVLEIGTVRFLIEGMKFSGVGRTEIRIGDLEGMSKTTTTSGVSNALLSFTFRSEGVRGEFGQLTFEANETGIQVVGRQIPFDEKVRNVWISREGEVLKTTKLAE